VLAIPGFVGSALDPLIGAAGDTSRRRALLVLGGLGLAVSTALSAGALGLWMLLVALVIGNPAVGAFVSLAQATLMDLEPGRANGTWRAGLWRARSATSAGRCCSRARSG
jgi:MFS transporter, FSR family, fosmidomycin resistance protein